MTKANNASNDTPRTPHMPPEATPAVEKWGGDLNNRGEGVFAKSSNSDTTPTTPQTQKDRNSGKNDTPTPTPPISEKVGSQKNKTLDRRMTKNEKGETVWKSSGKKVGRPKLSKTGGGGDGRHDPRQLVLINKIKEAVAGQDPERLKGLNMGKLMRESGYSVTYSKQPNILAKTNQFQQLLEKHMPDDIIAKVHGEALEAEKLNHYVFPAGEKDSVIKDVVESVAGCKLIKIRKKMKWKRAYFTAPDTGNRMRAIQEAYKVKGRYPAEKHEHFVAKVVVTNYAE